MSGSEQADYQVRLAWGAAGFARVAPADVVVVVDVLADGGTPGEVDPELLAAVSGGGAVVLRGGLTNASAVARRCLALQHERAARTSITLVLAGDGGAFSPEDLLGAGAVVAALSERGTDHTSPDAAVACEAWAGLRRAVVHLISASGAGRALAGEGRADVVAAASALDSSADVPRLVAGVWSVDG